MRFGAIRKFCGGEAGDQAIGGSGVVVNSKNGCNSIIPGVSGLKNRMIAYIKLTLNDRVTQVFECKK